eukprot:UN14300
MFAPKALVKNFQKKLHGFLYVFKFKDSILRFFVVFFCRFFLFNLLVSLV